MNIFGTVPRICTLVGLMFVGQSAFASTFTGVTIAFVSGMSPTGNGLLRVSIQIPSGPTSCGNATWYAYEYNGTGIGGVWTATLLAAQASGRSVLITGTGTCDQFAVEGVAAIQLN
jgi:hypothetical protein